MASPPATTSSSSITRRFDALKKESRRALVCYVTAGHPDVGRSLETLRALEEGGADIIELAWITGPSAIGSQKGTPSSMMSAPPYSRGGPRRAHKSG